jgi:hypothetical protein
MRPGRKRRSRIGGGALFLTLLVLAGTGASSAQAAGPPIIVESWSSQVFAASARLNARINPNEAATSYHFDYITKAAYDANGGNFTGASRIPLLNDANVGSGGSPVNVLQFLSGLKSETTYYYRAAAKNSQSGGNYAFGPTNFFTTQPSSIGADTCANKVARDQQAASFLPDCRAWEMVSPIDKNGGQAGVPEAIAAGGVSQAAVAGSQITYGSEASFEGGGQGAPPVSQYIATRTAGGWAATNINPPLFSGTYDSEVGGAPFQIFSPDLARALLLNGEHCRGEGSDCAVANPPLAGTSAPAGYQNYYLRNNGSGGYEALLGSGNSGFLALEPSDFDLELAGIAPELTRGVLSTCAALTANATEVPLGEGCDPAKQNLYLYASGSPLTLVNLLPAQSTGTPGAKLGDQSGAVSADGSRVYWNDKATGHLYLRSGGQTALVAEAATFQTASADGAFAFYTKADEHLYRYSTAGASSADLTPGGGVEGVLGASSSGDAIYYLDGGGLRRWKSGTTTSAAADADASNYPPATGTSRVSSDGSRLLFVATAQLTGYDNKDLSSGLPDSQVYLYGAAGPTLTCVSCNPTNGRPIGASTIPGAIANGSAEGSLEAYKPRLLSTNGRRVFFDSADALYLSDTNNSPDAYQWEAQGEGGCAKAGGCLNLVSDGRTAGGSRFVDASADGSDAFLITNGSLVAADPGALDLYDARVGGGFPVPVAPLPCEGDACQALPPEPVDPTLTTLLPGPGNPPVRYPKTNKKCKKGKVRRKGKCVKKRTTRRQGKRSQYRTGSGR